jgi:hypothetical protein
MDGGLVSLTISRRIKTGVSFKTRPFGSSGLMSPDHFAAAKRKTHGRWHLIGLLDWVREGPADGPGDERSGSTGHHLCVIGCSHC